MRVRIDLAYDGARFSGWARQPGLRTVQGVLEATIAQVLRLEQPLTTVCAGRTDAGVHARGQVVHLDLPDTGAPPPDGWVAALARRLPRALPDDVAVRAVRAVPEVFDARFSALCRRYVYRLWDDGGDVDPLRRGFIVAYPHRLDVAVMAEAGRRLLGLHDFAAFCRPRAGSTTIRTLTRLEPVRRPGSRIDIHVEADAFCHSMVRSLTGALVACGRGRRDLSWLAGLLTASRRASDVTVMPAHGLTLEEVVYPADDQLAARADQARSRRQNCECPA